MKKTLLFAIIALSINAFAQNMPRTLSFQHPTEKFRGRMEFSGLKTSNNLIERKSVQPIKDQALVPGLLVQLNDSVYRWEWDTISLGWNIYFRYINIVYDASYNMLNETGQMWNGGVWADYMQNTFSYDANNNQTSLLVRTWDGFDWMNYYQTSCNYDANNNQTNYLSQNWNGSAWVNSFQMIYTYDANNNQTSSLFQNWNGTAWVNSWFDIFTYDANNLMLNYLSQSWNGTIWVDSYRTTYTYDANNNVTLAFGQSWNGTTWVDYFQVIYTYDASNNRTNLLGQNWSGGVWVDSYRYEYTYDANNNQTAYLSQDWNGSSWVNTARYIAAYDVSNFNKGFSNTTYNDAGTAVKYGDSTNYYYHTVNVGINSLIAGDCSMLVYPNPCRGKFTVSGNDKITEVEVFNITGEIVYTEFNFSQQASIDLSGFSKGIYVVKIYSGTRRYITKIVIQ